MDEQVKTLLLLVGLLLAILFIASLAVAVLKSIVWKFAIVFFYIDDAMWFLYNPFRAFMKKHHTRTNRVWFVTLSLFLIKPIYQFIVYAVTTPLRMINALYFDVLLYLFIMFGDTAGELFNPKVNGMRHHKGTDYLFKWVLGFPKRLIVFISKNIFALIDSVMMFIISTAWPTFTMFHGSPIASASDISQTSKWLVGPGNYGGSGIYFARKIRAARHYARAKQNSRESNSPIIVARVTFTMTRNLGTLAKSERDIAGRGGWKGQQLAKNINFPFYATEMWRSGDGINWWEYCLLQGGKDKELISSWRIRPIGLLKTTGNTVIGSSLTRLWKGKAHYCLSIPNILLAVSSAIYVLYILATVTN